jgi:hypothetical protein
MTKGEVMTKSKLWNQVVKQRMSSRVIKRITLATIAPVFLTIFVLEPNSARRRGNAPANSTQNQTVTDWKTVEQALGKAGAMQPGDVYKVSLPRSDLSAELNLSRRSLSDRGSLSKRSAT